MPGKLFETEADLEPLYEDEDKHHHAALQGNLTKPEIVSFIVILLQSCSVLFRAFLSRIKVHKSSYIISRMVCGTPPKNVSPKKVLVSLNEWGSRKGTFSN